MNVAQFVRWVAFPLALVVVTGVLNLLAPPAGTVGRDAEILDVDGKLDRTVGAFFDANADRSMTAPGLRVEVTMSERDRLAFREEWSYSAEATLAFGGRPNGRASLRTRGKSSRRTERKSFTVELIRPQRFGDVELERFFLLNLLYDPSGFEMVTSYGLLEELGLFASYHQLVTLFVNGHSDGLYLLVERPEDAIVRTVPGVVGVYRIGQSEIDVEFSSPRPTPMAVVNAFVALRDRDISDEARAREAERLVDLDRYFRWLGFNALFENGDSRFEFYYYEAGGRLGLMAWDYDDLQAPPIRPAEAALDPLLYAAEMPFDFIVRDNPVLYGRYRDALDALLDRLTESVLRDRLAETRRLLDAIDTGLDAASELRVDAQRERDMELFEERLVARHRELRGALADAASE